jgi:hypothetical protein
VQDIDAEPHRDRLRPEAQPERSTLPLYRKVRMTEKELAFRLLLWLLYHIIRNRLRDRDRNRSAS